MATKIIKAWINGEIQEIEVEDIVSPEQPLSYEDRLCELEDKPIITDGNLLVGNGTEELEEMTPEEVLSHINGASIATMTTEEYEAMGDSESNANTLYVLTDAEEQKYVQTINGIEPDENGNVHVDGVSSGVGQKTADGGEIFNDYENNEASGDYSHAEGYNTTAESMSSHAEGVDTVAKGSASHSEGNGTTAEGEYSHAEGSDTTATGENSHTEGQGTNTMGTNSHAEGHSTTAEGENAHAEGEGAFAEGHNSHAEGYDTVAKGDASHAEGANTIADVAFSHAEGYKSAALGEASHAEGTNKANLDKEEYTTTVEFITPYPELLPEGADPETPITVEVNGATAIGVGAHAEGCTTLAYGYSSHAEGCDTFARGGRSHSEGTSTKAWGHKSHAEGGNTIAVGIASHAEGEGTGFYKFINQDADTVCNDWKSLDRDNKFHMAYGTDSHVEGKNNLATGTASHAEGFATLSQGTASHTEGRETAAIGNQAHAEGRDTVAQGSYSHAEGQGTIAKYNHQHVQGKYNEPLGSNYLHIVGNGSGEDVLDESGNVITKNRSNAHTLDKNGNAWFAGDVYIGESGENNKLITKKQLDEAISQIIDLLVVSGVAPVMLDANGEMLVENDGTILINM